MSLAHLHERVPVFYRWLRILLLAAIFGATGYAVSGQAQVVNGVMPSPGPTMTSSATRPPTSTPTPMVNPAR